MTNNEVFTPKPDEIKTVVVVDLHGRTQTYSSLLSAIAAVHQLPQEAVKSIKAMLEEARKTEGD